MTTPATISPRIASATAVPAAGPALRRLFLTLFLRGRSSRGLQKQTAPKSIGRKLGITLTFYALIGCFSLAFVRQPVFALAVYLHAMTFVFLGMFVASSTGEILFNKEEADILLHRPISPRTLLWAKVRVLLEVSLWLAGAFNLMGFFVGLWAPNGGWRFPVVHLISTTLEATTCVGCVILTYQLCLRWFGRERLDGLMTTAQVIVSIAVVVSGQVLPQLVLHMNKLVTFNATSWWLVLLPPAWFAGFDDALAGGMAGGSWILATLAVVATAVILWLAFGKLAQNYETGLQRLGETAPRPARKRTGRRWIDILVEGPPLRWCLRDPVARASFLLTAAYLVRDRDVKLRVFPGIAPILVIPVIIFLQDRGRTGGTGGFGPAFASAYLGVIPMLAMSLLQYSQQWQASDIFRAAPMAGPVSLCAGARSAVLCFLTMPAVVVFALIVWLAHRDVSQLLLLLPGVIALPVFALVPNMGGKGVPLSLPTEEAKSAGRGLTMVAVMLVAMALSGLAAWSWWGGWFAWLVGIELLLAAGLHLVLRRAFAKARWPSME